MRGLRYGGAFASPLRALCDLQAQLTLTLSRSLAPSLYLLQSAQPCPQWTDTSTAQLNYGALQSFYSKFPEYKTNPFYIWGES